MATVIEVIHRDQAQPEVITFDNDRRVVTTKGIASRVLLGVKDLPGGITLVDAKLDSLQIAEEKKVGRPEEYLLSISVDSRLSFDVIEGSLPPTTIKHISIRRTA